LAFYFFNRERRAYLALLDLLDMLCSKQEKGFTIEALSRLSRFIEPRQIQTLSIGFRERSSEKGLLFEIASRNQRNRFFYKVEAIYRFYGSICLLSSFLFCYLSIK
jgi:hypothetical protein